MYLHIFLFINFRKALAYSQNFIAKICIWYHIYVVKFRWTKNAVEHLKAGIILRGIF